MPLSLSRPDLLCSNNFILNHWTGATDTFDVIDPATGALIASVPDSGAKEAQAALDAASDAFEKWKNWTAKERGRVVRAWFDRVMDHQEDLAKLLCREQGKPLAEGMAEIAYAASYIQWFSEQATRMNGDIIPAPAKKNRMLVFKEPVGVVAAVTPWNFPAAMIARKIAPALAAGCSVVCKPAEDAPLTSLALARLAQEAGIPAGVLNIVTASRDSAATVVDVWLDDDRVRKVTFTGSTSVGQHLARRSSKTLKKLSLELGGNAPFIVFDDANLDAAIDGLIAAKFRNSGQTCVSPNRIYVQRPVYEKFSELLAQRVRALHVGPATDPRSQVGPLINERAVEKVETHVADALSKGAHVLVGGERLLALGKNYFSPTVLIDVQHNMNCYCEETFGPVAAISPFDTESEVVKLANATPYGLAAYFFTEDSHKIWRVSEALNVGIVGVNEGAVSNELAPFGGVKYSGYGREGSVYGLDDYLSLKYVCLGGMA